MTTRGERFALLVIGQRRRDFQIYYRVISLLPKKYNWSLTPNTLLHAARITGGQENLDVLRAEH